MKIYIWGTGEFASSYLKTNEVKKEQIIGFIESKKTKEIFCDKKVYEPCEITENNDYDYILICVGGGVGREIYDTCVTCHIDVSKVILLDNWEWADYEERKDLNGFICDPFRTINKSAVNIDKIFPVFSKWVKSRDKTGSYVVAHKNNYDAVEEEALIKTELFKGMNYQGDYFRYRTFELTANELIKQKIEGDVAELGVYKGDFAAFINAKFPKKKLYLFDTFDSFDVEEFQAEVDEGRCDELFINVFKDTSVESVIGRMPYKDQCIIRKGLFPETAVGLEQETFVFVSIDVDFEKSILEGLRYFYPRLNKGGVLFVHDFNNLSLEGVEVAVDVYEKEIGSLLCKVPLADHGGTLVVVK